MGYFEAGSFAIVNDEPFSNRAGRTNIESCCWWGRGAAQLKGVCMYGKLNYYIGARAKEEGRKSMFPDIDVSSSSDHLIYTNLDTYPLTRPFFFTILPIVPKVLQKAARDLFWKALNTIDLGEWYGKLDRKYSI